MTLGDAIPRDTLSLDEPHWQRPRDLALVLLPRMQAIRGKIYVELGWPTEDGRA